MKRQREERKENKTKNRDTETVKRMLFLHHYFSTHSPSTVSSSLYYSRSLSSFVSIIHPLFQSLSLVFISLSLSLSVVQTLRQMSHEIFPIKTQTEFLCVYECVYVCGWQAVHIHVCVFILTLKSVRSTSRSGS